MSFNNPYNPYQTPRSFDPRPLGPLPQSGFGTASFVIGIGSVIADSLLLLVAALQSDVRTTDTMDTLMGLVCCGCVVLNIVGVVLAIVGLVQPQRRRGFAIAGLLLNLIPLLAIAGVVVLGLLIVDAAMNQMGLLDRDVPSLLASCRFLRN